MQSTNAKLSVALGATGWFTVFKQFTTLDLMVFFASSGGILATRLLGSLSLSNHFKWSWDLRRVRKQFSSRCLSDFKWRERDACPDKTRVPRIALVSDVSYGGSVFTARYDSVIGAPLKRLRCSTIKNTASPTPCPSCLASAPTRPPPPLLLLTLWPEQHN